MQELYSVLRQVVRPIERSKLQHCSWEWGRCGRVQVAAVGHRACVLEYIPSLQFVPSTNLTHRPLIVSPKKFNIYTDRVL